MILTGEQIIKYQIVQPFCYTKQDDGIIPSYGPDGMLYTLRGDVPWDFYKLPALRSLTFKTLETVHMPYGSGGLLTLKSTYSRQGVILVTNSPVDPSYEGHLTIRLFNSNVYDEVLLYGAGGFMQMTVHMLAEETKLTYIGRHQNG